MYSLRVYVKRLRLNQLTTDGFAPYRSAIDSTLSDRVDYAMLIKQHAEDTKAEKRYSPAECIGCKKHAVIVDPDPAMISTSHIERSNLTMRIQVKRLARLTLSFSKKWENLWSQSRSTSPITTSAAFTAR